MKTKFQYILMTVAMVAMASCSQDEVLIPSAEVQDIRIVVSDFPAFDDAQTRAIGTFDSGKTAWVPDDVIYIVAANKGVDSQILTLTYGADGEWSADGTTIHYLSASDTHIRAIYAPNCKKEDTEIKAKDNLPYGTGEFLEKECFVENGTLTVDFTNYERPYSRLRIVTEPNEQITVTTTMFNPAGYKDADAYNYTLTADANGNAYLYGTFEASGTVEVKGKVTTQYTFTATTVAGNSYALFARRGANLAKLTSTYVINDSETHYFYGSGNYGIKVESGSPTIVLSDAKINVSSGIAISITEGTTTIQVVGSENSVTSNNSAGIYVAEESTVTITGNSREDKLIVKGNDGSSGIGGYVINDILGESANSGNINIRNVTLYAYSESMSIVGTISPGIGSTGSATCQSIIIDNATVYAYGCGLSLCSAPAIGNGLDYLGDSASSTPTVTISNNSEVHAHRGAKFSDYIGRAGYNTELSGNVIATVDANSVVYKYTGSGNTPDY